MSYCKEDSAGVLISVYIQPNASKSEIVGLHGEDLKIKIKAPPVDGEANEELIQFLSKKLKIAKSKIQIVRGQTSRQKKVQVLGLQEKELKQRLEIQ